MNYNIRVYGILLRPDDSVLLSDEVFRGYRFTKFPGGGHLPGEGLMETLKREFREEMGIDIEIKKHFYVNTDFVASFFDESQQLIAHYFLVESAQHHLIKGSNKKFDFPDEAQKSESFRWISIADLNEDIFTFPIDKRLVSSIKNLKFNRKF